MPREVIYEKKICRIDISTIAYYSISVCDINYTLFLIVTGVTLRQVTQYIRSEATPYGSVGTCTVFFLIDIAIFQKHNSGTGRKRLYDNFWLLTFI